MEIKGNLLMSFDPSLRVQNIKPSPTLAVTAKAQALRASGKDVIDLGVGEPDFDTPEHIKEAAIKALHQGATKYTAVDGTPALKAAVIEKFRRDNQLEYKPNQVLVSCGGKQSFFNLCLALINPGDEVIIPAPFWVSYPDIVKVAEGTPVIVPTTQAQNFKITAEQLERAITPRTKLVVINSPSNPTGKAYLKSELQAIGNVLLKHPQIMIATDDMYELILWRQEEGFSNILNVHPALYDRTFVLNGVSKAYAMTGWRIGYCAGPEKIIAAMKVIQSQSTSNPAAVSQAAAVAALNGPQDCIQTMIRAFKARHEYIVGALNQIPGISCTEADGAFYVFPDVSELIKEKKLANDLALSELWLNEANIALVPGSAFGTEGHVRISFATSQENLEKAIARIRNLA
jgi:aspartate aminotransferase